MSVLLLMFSFPGRGKEPTLQVEERDILTIEEAGYGNEIYSFLEVNIGGDTVARIEMADLDSLTKEELSLIGSYVAIIRVLSWDGIDQDFWWKLTKMFIPERFFIKEQEP